MVTFDDAIALVRNTFKQDYILYGFEYDGEYVFEILSFNFKQMYTNQSLMVSVPKKDGEVYIFDLGKAIDDPDGYVKARENKVIIDVVKEDSK